MQGKGKLAAIDAMDFLKVIMTHNMMKRYDMEAVAAAKAARMKVAAVTLSTRSQCERFAKVPAPPEGQRMVRRRSVTRVRWWCRRTLCLCSSQAPHLPPPMVTGRFFARSVQARGDGPILAHLVQAAPSSSLVLPSD